MPSPKPHRIKVQVLRLLAFRTVGITISICVGAGLLYAVAALLLRASLSTELVTLVVLALLLLVGVYILRTRKTMTKQVPTSTQQEIKVYEAWISDEAIARLLTLFREDPHHPGLQEAELLLVTRRHKFKLVVPFMQVGLLMLVLLAGSLWLNVASPHLPLRTPAKGSHAKSTYLTLSVPWWLPLLVVLFGAVSLVVVWAKWSSFYLLVTNKYIGLAHMYSPYFWWVAPETIWMPARSIDVVSARASSFGRLVGLDYGSIDCDSAAGTDKPFNDIEDMPRPDKIRTTLMSARDAALKPG